MDNKVGQVDKEIDKEEGRMVTEFKLKIIVGVNKEVDKED